MIDAGTPADVRMQQATLNLLADMGAQPATRQSGLVAASASTDTAPPSSFVTSPIAGATVQLGEVVTISGTATDAAVESSVASKSLSTAVQRGVVPMVGKAGLMRGRLQRSAR